jgi:N-acetylmuramoyl-L-alanine amidase
MRYFIILIIFSSLSFLSLAQNGIRFKTLVIDAGHGGKDPGAIGSKAYEKNITLAVALKLGKYVTENFPDIKVVYTRSKDVFVPLDERARIANNNKADLFISVHANWVSNPAIKGTETFVLGLHRSQDNLEVAKKENSVIVLEDDYTAKYEGFDPNSTESYIIFELMQNAHLDQSIQFASLVEDQFTSKAGRYSRGVKQAGFLVIRETAMPSVLVEVGYLTNRDEEAYLLTADGQAETASAIYRAFKEYKDEFEAKSQLGKTGTITKATTANDVKPKADIVFKVQVATSPSKLTPGKGKLRQFDHASMYYDSKLYKYTVGETAKFDEAKKLLAETKKSVADAFIVAFEDGKRIPLESALAKLNIKQ